MANTREFRSSMSAPRSGNANLDITVNGTTTNYNPFGPDRSITIHTGGTENVFIDAPVDLDANGVTQYDDGSDGREKYVRCMELLGDGLLPVCTARNRGPAGTHGAFGTLSYITDDCELCFSFPTFDTLTSSMILKLTPAGMWYKVT
jgi:hypothetical protein